MVETPCTVRNHIGGRRLRAKLPSAKDVSPDPTPHAHPEYIVKTVGRAFAARAVRAVRAKPKARVHVDCKAAQARDVTRVGS